jgi:DNA-binding NtrC family response regulator
LSYFEQNRKCRIFVVDDEEIISATIAAILRLKGFEATAFTLPLEALAASHLEVPDLLISDIVMPMLSGVELAIQLRAFHPGCKVLLFSGEWAAADFPDSAREDKHDFEIIPKPVHPKELLRKVQEMLITTPAPGTGEDRARTRLARNMKETIAAVQADIAVSTERKKSAKTRPARDSGE